MTLSGKLKLGGSNWLNSDYGNAVKIENEAHENCSEHQSSLEKAPNVGESSLKISHNIFDLKQTQIVAKIIMPAISRLVDNIETRVIFLEKSNEEFPAKVLL